MSHAMTVIVLTWEGLDGQDRNVRRVYVKPGATPSDVRDYVGEPGLPAIYNDSHGIDLFALVGFRQVRPDMDFQSVGGSYQAGGLHFGRDVTLRCDGVVSALSIGIADGQLDAFVAQLAQGEKDRRPGGGPPQTSVHVQRSDDTDGMSA